MNELTAVPDYEFDLTELAAAALAAREVTTGLWRIGVKLRFAALTAAFEEAGNPVRPLPAGLVGIEGIALFKAKESGPMVFDAAALRTVPNVSPITTKRSTRLKKTPKTK